MMGDMHYASRSFDMNHARLREALEKELHQQLPGVGLHIVLEERKDMSRYKRLCSFTVEDETSSEILTALLRSLKQGLEFRLRISGIHTRFLFFKWSPHENAELRCV